MKKLILTVLILLLTTNAYSMFILEAIFGTETKEEAVEIIVADPPTIEDFEAIPEVIPQPATFDEITFDRDYVTMPRECVFSGTFRNIPPYRVRVECKGDSGAHKVAAAQTQVFNKTVGVEDDPPIIFLEDGLMINMFYFNSVVIGNTDWVVSVDSNTLTLAEQEEIEEMFVNWKEGLWTTSETSKSRTFRFIR